MAEDTKFLSHQFRNKFFDAFPDDTPAKQKKFGWDTDRGEESNPEEFSNPALVDLQSKQIPGNTDRLISSIIEQLMQKDIEANVTVMVLSNLRKRRILGQKRPRSIELRNGQLTVS